ncbi:MAG: DUF1854 domain-containing protein [Candidatus Brocadiaceae bacterium]|nr:DUF1854 domain-containing protein [Candidatus Brocadiaceae bacterium]
MAQADAPQAGQLHDTLTAAREGRPGWLTQPEGARIWEDPFHRLHVSVDGREYENVRPRRTFPLSGKADYVSFMDENDKEVLLLAHPQNLDRESRRALEAALKRVYYVATILRVDAVSEKMGVSHWEVKTDRGYAMFEVVDRNRHIRRLPGDRVMIVDADGNRFEIPNVTELDERSQALVRSET